MRIFDPYPVPFSYANTSTISPLTIGVAVIVPIEPPVISAFTLIVTGGYEILCHPVPGNLNLTKFLLS